jgi:hypothetical protein
MSNPINVPGAFYEELANMAGWRSRCGYCGCPKWAHASPERADLWAIVMRECGCGQCRGYVPRRARAAAESQQINLSS